MSDLWFSISANDLAKVGAEVEDPSPEGRHEDRDEIDWKSVGIAVRRLFGLTDTPLEGADPQGGATEDAVAAATAGLGDRERNIVTDWLRVGPPEALVDFAAKKDQWTVSNGRHRLTGVWSVEPDWQVPLQLAIPDVDGDESATTVNMALAGFRDLRADLDAGRVSLPDTTVNAAFTTAVHTLAARPNVGAPVPKPLHFTWSGPDPERFFHNDGFSRVFAWPKGKNLMLVLDAPNATSRESVHGKIQQIAGAEGNERLQNLIDAADSLYIVGQAVAIGKAFWQEGWFDHLQFLTPLPKSKPLNTWTFGDVTCTSTLDPDPFGTLGVKTNE